MAGKGNGFVDAFDLEGHMIDRVGSGGTLDSPWGLAIAPQSFGKFAGDLLVGNFATARSRYCFATRATWLGLRHSRTIMKSGPTSYSAAV